MNDVPKIFTELESGDDSGAEQLLPLVDDKLRELAATKLTEATRALAVSGSTANNDWAYAKA